VSSFLRIYLTRNITSLTLMKRLVRIFMMLVARPSRFGLARVTIKEKMHLESLRSIVSGISGDMQRKMSKTLHQYQLSAYHFIAVNMPIIS
jgi:hypothetical protein